MDQEKLLRSATGWQRRGRKETATAGTSAKQYIQMKQRQLEKNAEVVDIWQEILPQIMYEYCSLAKISAGAMYIEVESGTYMHQMQMMITELLETIQGRCPYAGIKKIILRPKRAKPAVDEQT